MPFVIDIHFLLAFLVALCVLVFSWNAMGRRVVNGVLGLQVLVGLVVAGMFGANHTPLPKDAPLHIAAALVALVCYGAASAAGKRGAARAALLLSIAGLLCVGVALAYGLQMYFHG